MPKISAGSFAFLGRWVGSFDSHAFAWLNIQIACLQVRLIQIL